MENNKQYIFKYDGYEVVFHPEFDENDINLMEDRGWVAYILVETKNCKYEFEFYDDLEFGKDLLNSLNTNHFYIQTEKNLVILKNLTLDNILNTFAYFYKTDQFKNFFPAIKAIKPFHRPDSVII